MKTNQNRSGLNVNTSYQGNTIERELKIIMSNEEKLDIGKAKAMIYTERKHGVVPAYDIRTDASELRLDKITEINNKMFTVETNKVKEEETGEESTDEPRTN